MAFALLEWPNADSKKFLKIKLPEIALGASLDEVHNDLLHGLYLLISSSDVSFAQVFLNIYFLKVNSQRLIIEISSTPRT